MRTATFYIAFLTSLCVTPALGETPGVVHFPLERDSHTLARRAGEDEMVHGILSNHKYYYSLRVSIGTPPQELRVGLDTGSSDFYVVTAKTDVCKQKLCIADSEFDDSKSKTLRSNDTYVDYFYNGEASGYYAQDVLQLGDVKINNLNFAVVDVASTVSGIAGIGLAAREAHKGGSNYQSYSNLPLQLKEQGLISHVAYSLYLDSISNGIGKITFGGINTGAIDGDLYVFPLASNTSLSLKLQSIFLMNDHGDQEMVYKTSSRILFDSLESFTWLPESVLTPLMKDGLNATNVDGSWLVDCESLENNSGGIGFSIGGVEIITNFRDLLYELVNDKGKRICSPGFGESIDTFRLGDNVLRTLYVVYDLENMEIGIAKAKTASVSTSYVLITDRIPGTRAPQYEDSVINESKSPTSVPHTVQAFTAVTEPFSQVASQTNNISVTIGGQATASGLPTPYGGIGTFTTKEAPAEESSAGKKKDSSDGSTIPRAFSGLFAIGASLVYFFV